MFNILMKKFVLITLILNKQSFFQKQLKLFSLKVNLFKNLYYKPIH